MRMRVAIRDLVGVPEHDFGYSQGIALIVHE